MLMIILTYTCHECQHLYKMLILALPAAIMGKSACEKSAPAAGIQHTCEGYGMDKNGFPLSGLLKKS